MIWSFGSCLETSSTFLKWFRTISFYLQLLGNKMEGTPYKNISGCRLEQMINISDVRIASLDPTLMAVKDRSQSLLLNSTLSQGRNICKTRPIYFFNKIETFTRNECPLPYLLSCSNIPPSKSALLEAPQKKSIIGRILGRGSLTNSCLKYPSR